MDFSLQLRHCRQQQHGVAGVLIRGNDPARWLGIASTWNVATSSLRFLPVHETPRNIPPSAQDTHNILGIGALCFVANGQFPEYAASHPEVMPYRCRADRLFLPLDAEVDPAVSESDLLQLLAQQRHYVWHPSIGLIGYDKEHTFSAHDLIIPPPVTVSDWDAAEIGEQLNDTIRNLFPEPLPDAGNILNNGQDDIGTESDSLEDAPRAPDEKHGAAIRDAVQGAADGVNAAFAKAIHGLTSRLPTSADGSGSNMFGRLHAWADSILNGDGSRDAGVSGEQDWQLPNKRLTTKRENELKRLMNLLTNDPDQGLKYAIPMGGEDRGRGLARPSDQLMANDTEFNLNQLHQSGRADIWDMPWEYQVRLIEMYRDLAQREQRLGRYRRAAYIYAALLNDMSAAAAALEAGRLYHDAAGVYMEHLKDPTRAAECLRRGGFWEEAVQIYRNRERWMDAGELYTEIGRPDDAREMYRIEIKELKDRRDYAAAGELADRKLDDPDFATTLLFNGWMQNANASGCFRKLMTINGRRGNHRNAIWAMQQLTAEDEFNGQQLEDAIKVCSESATSYPDESVRTAARQHTLRLAAALLKPAESTESTYNHATALTAVRALAQSDRLLQADTHRFQLNQESSKPVPTAEDTDSRSSIRPVKHIKTLPFEPEGTPKNTRWVDIVCTGNFLFRCGITPQNRMVVARQMLGSRRDGGIVSEDTVIVLPDPTHIEPDLLRLRPAEAGVFLASFPSEGTSWFALGENLNVIRDSGFVEVISSGRGQLLDARVYPKGGVLCLNWVAGESTWPIELNIQNKRMLRLRTIKVKSNWNELVVDGDHPFPRLCSSVHPHILIGKTLLKTKANTDRLIELDFRSIATVIVEEFSETPTRVIESPQLTVSRLVFSFEQGARVLWTERNSSKAFAQDLANPLTAFAANGTLIAVCQQTNRACFYRLSNGNVELIAETQAKHPVQEVTCGISPNQFLLFHNDGKVTQLEVPVR